MNNTKYKNINYKKIILFMSTIIICILFSAITLNAKAVNKSHDNYLSNVQKKGTLVMGTSPDYPPYEFNKNNQVKGADIELGKQIAKNMHVKLKIKSMSFDSLLVALKTGKVDMVISGLNETPERAKNVDFSKDYYDSNQMLLINKHDQNKIKSYHDLNQKNIGAQTGSMQYNLAKQQIPKANLKSMENLNDLVLGLKTNKVSSILMDSAPAQAFASNTSGIKAIPAGVKSTGNSNNIAFPKGATSLVNSANHTINSEQRNDSFEKQYIPAASKSLSQKSKKKNANSMWNYKEYFIKGTGYTLFISIVSTFFGIILGTIFSLMRLGKSKILHAIAVCYIEFIRGTPLMVQIMFVYFGIGMFVNIPALASGIIAISINSGAYVAEIIRSGINSIDQGQSDASLSLGLSKAKTMQSVIFPQAMKNIWPTLGNEFVTLIKNSSIVSIIGITDLMYQMKIVQADTYKGILPIFITMIIYFVITFAISRTMKYFEGRFNHENTN